jgi:hypothetical protein
MLFLVAKHLLPPQTVRYRGNVYALRTQPKQRIRFPSRHTAPPVPGVPEPDAADAIQEGVVPLSALPRTKWKHKMTHKDIEENGVIVKRQGLTVLEGELFWKGKFRQPPVTLEFTWEYTLDPKTGKYFLTHAELEDGSSHVLVDEHGKPTSLAGALFTIRHALGKNPTEPPPNLEQAQRVARYVKYDCHVYCRADAAQFIAAIRTGKSSWGWRLRCVPTTTATTLPSSPTYASRTWLTAARAPGPRSCSGSPPWPTHTTSPFGCT